MAPTVILARSPSRSSARCGPPRLVLAGGDVCLLRQKVVAADAGDDDDDGVGVSSTGRDDADDAVFAEDAQQQSSANTDELTVVAVDPASSLQLLHDVRMEAMGAAADDDDDFDGLRNRSDAAGSSCSVCLGTSEKLSRLPLSDMPPGVGWITCGGHVTDIILLLIMSQDCSDNFEKKSKFIKGRTKVFTNYSLSFTD